MTTPLSDADVEAMLADAEYDLGAKTLGDHVRALAAEVKRLRLERDWARDEAKQLTTEVAARIQNEADATAEVVRLRKPSLQSARCHAEKDGRGFPCWHVQEPVKP